MTTPAPDAPIDEAPDDRRDSLQAQPGVVAGLGWVLTWLAAIVAVLVTAVSASTALQLTGIPDPGQLTTYGLPVVSGIGQVSVSIAIGAALFAAFLVPPQQDGVLDIGGYRAIRIAATAALVWAGCALLLVPLSISNVSGYPLSETIQPANLMSAYSQVAEAQTWLWTAVFAAVAAVIGRVALRWGWTFAALGASLLSLMPLALAGHSASGGNHDVATNSLILHVVGASVWLGGLFAVIAYVLGGGRWGVLAVQRFSRIAFWCLIIVGISGVINALVRVSFDDLFDSTYGLLVVLKVVALVVLGALGAWHRRATISELAARDPEDTGRSLFARFGLVELLVFAVTFGLAVGLSRTPPPDTTGATDLSTTELELGFSIDAKPTLGRLLGDWRFDLIYGTLAIVLAALYLRGVWRLRRRGDPWPIGRTLAWIAGCVLLLLATSSGFGRYSPAMFSIHMISHMILSMLVPVLLVLGGPVTLALRALKPAGRNNPPGPREWILAAIHSPVARFFGNPFISTALFLGSFYVLYLGGLFDTIVEYHSAHLLMNLHFLLSGYLFYWVVIGIDPTPRTLSPVVKLGLVMGALPFHAFFGIALMMTNHVIAESYYRGLALPFAYDLFGDQRVGGGIAWAAGEVPLIIIMLALFLQWRRSDEREAKRYDRRADRDNDEELEQYNRMLQGLSDRSHPPS